MDPVEITKEPKAGHFERWTQKRLQKEYFQDSMVEVFSRHLHNHAGRPMEMDAPVPG